MGIGELIGLVAGIVVIAIIVAVCVIFRKNIAAFFKKKSDAKQAAKSKEKEEQAAQKSVVGNVFKQEEKQVELKEQAPKENRSTGEYVNAQNFVPKKEEPKEEPKDFNVMSQFKKK